MSAQYFTQPRYFPSPQQTSSSARPQAHSAAQQQQQQQQQPSFTPAMRDRQARGKDPYSPHDSPSDSDLDFDAMDSPSARTGGGGGGGSSGGGGVGRLGHLPAGVGAAGGTYEDQRQRQFAIEILDDPEKLAMYACSRGDSIPGTRLHFTRILCGMNPNSALQDHRKNSSVRRDRNPPRRRSVGAERAGRH
ncbi:hypothetical protein CTRI78_v000591 [Colletotrichum trifolii]|uniref:Uncharacterized protein n=1 Tax=Colletotrichum trifolii TaxID=5466 RepID=A0A4V3HXP5_COLTR|nr:hypothetical protein CTRI78_v000591 [Colletotrichum trifolii]